MSIYMRVIFRKQSQLRLLLFQTGRITARFQAAVPLASSNRAQNFSVRQFLRNNHRDVARDRWISIELSKFLCRCAFVQKEIGIQLGNKHRTRRARFACHELPSKADSLIGGANVDREREIRELSRPKRQIWNNAFKRTFQIKQVEAAPCL